MAQKKAQPTATKGKSGSEKTVAAKAPVQSAVKSMVKAASATKPAMKSAPSKSVPTKSATPKPAPGKVAQAPAAKKLNTPAPTIKKPTSSAKLTVVAAAPKAAPAAPAKSDLTKVEMTTPATKKVEPAKVAQKKPDMAAKPTVAVAKPAVVAPAKPVVAVAKPVVPAPALAAKPAVSPFPHKPAFAAAKPGIVAPKAPSSAPVAAAAPAKPVSARHGFKTNEWIVYPAQGVGRIVAIEEQEIAGMKLELFVITFEKDKMTLRVPTGKAATVGMRKLAEDGVVKRAMETLKGKARIKRTMWSRRAQEFEAKINSGDLVSVAEVVRDLYRAESQPEQSYSERLLFERALDRMAREIAAVDKLDERGAAQKIVEVLSKSAKARKPVEETAPPDDDAEDATAAA